jgi:hypothetical protein
VVRDIDDNRRGRLSPEQAAYLKSTQRTSLIVWMLPAVYLGLMAGGSTLTSAFDRRSSIGTILLDVAAGIAILVVTALGGLYFWKRKGTLAKSTVTFLDGRVAWAGTPNRWPGGPPAGWVPADTRGVPLAIKPPAPLLPPGAYRFYLCDQYLVAAESPLDPTTYWSITQSSPMTLKLDGVTQMPPSPLPVGDAGALLAVLAGGMGFTREDLEHHRRGVLAPHQGMGRVMAIDGALSLAWAVRSKFDVDYRWEIGGRQFEIPLAWIWLAPPGVVYRCYIDQQSQRLLSLEPVTVRPDR